jgi:hypothetical protein
MSASPCASRDKASLRQGHVSVREMTRERNRRPLGAKGILGAVLQPVSAVEQTDAILLPVFRRAGRVPGRYLTAARLTLGCLTALSASRSRPRVTSIAVFTLPTNGTAFSIVSAAPLSHPFCRIAAPSVASAMAVPKNGIERPIRRDSRAPLQRATVRPMLMSVLGARAVPLRTSRRYLVWGARAVGKTVQRVETIRRSTFRFWPFLWSSLASHGATSVLLARRKAPCRGTTLLRCPSGCVSSLSLACTRVERAM